MSHRAMTVAGRCLTIVALGASLTLIGAHPAALAAERQRGTVVSVGEEVVKIKGDDGKTYEIDAAVVAAENLKTGDIVDYGVVQGKPTAVKKKKP